MPFFSSLTFTGTRVGGQRERQTQAFEAGTAYFPRDYPFTGSYVSHAEQRAQEENARWERKPPAKRANFEKLGTRSPWKADWEVVLGLEGAQTSDEGLTTTQREIPPVLLGKKLQPWLLRGVDVPTILGNASSLLNHRAGFLAEINKLRTKRNQDPLTTNIRPDDLLKIALVMVRLKMCGRGAPDDLAAIYSVDDDAARKWFRVINHKKWPEVVSAQGEIPDEVEVSSCIQGPHFVCVLTNTFSSRN